jgi:type IV pilus assembly PilX-like protein
MRDTRVPTVVVPREDSGFALVLAIMALMLLTFLGLTLATTTSTELQIATNYRWSQQALYNAEAGIEATKVLLAGIPVTTSWNEVMPSARTTTSWTVPFAGNVAQPALPTSQSAAVDEWGIPLRNWENDNCDERGGNVGYGVILEIPLSGDPLQNKTTLLGQNLNGAVTIWVRRPPLFRDDGTVTDVAAENSLVVTAEGSAPFSGGDVSSAFAQASRATRTLEVSLLRLVTAGEGAACEAYRAQAGKGVSGSGFGACSIVYINCGGTGGVNREDDLLEGALGQAARNRGGTHAHGERQAGSFSSSAGTACVE